MKINRMLSGTVSSDSKSKILHKKLSSSEEKDNFVKTEKSGDDIQVIKTLKSENTEEVKLDSIDSDNLNLTTAAAASVLPSPVAQAVRELTIIYTNDIHGAITPMKDSKHPGQHSGGISYLGSQIKQSKEDHMGSYILLDAGDWGQGSYESKMTKGKTMIDVMNHLGYDAAEIGNHEFDWGQDALGEMVDRADFPVLGANILKDGNLIEGVKPYTIKEVNGVKVGILGLLTPGTPGSTDPKNIQGLEFADVKKITEQYLPELKKEGAEFTVILSHLGDRYDKDLAKAVDGIDLIVGGHSHSKIFEPLQINNTLIVQSGTQGKHVGEINLELSEATNKIVSFKNSLIPVNDKDLKPDPEVEKIIAPIVNEAKEKLSMQVGKTEVDLTHDRKKVLETVMGNVLTDSMREGGACDIGMQNSGGIRDQIMSGEVTYGDLYRVLPFDKYLVTMDLNGSRVKKILENSAQRRKGNMQMSGITMDVDPKKPKGDKVSNIKVNGEALVPDKSYSVATDDFLAGGANGYRTFTEGENVKYGKLTVDVFKDYVEKHSPLTSEIAQVEGRINFLSPPPEYKAR